MTRFVACVLAAVAAVGVVAAKQKIRLRPPGVQQAPTKPLAVDDPKKPAIVLLDDHADALVTHLHNDGEFTAGTPASAEEVDVFSGATALRVSPLQRFSGHLAGWSYPIRETPKEGEFRYLRFAWKKLGGTGIMVQMHDEAKTWIVRYHAGQNAAGWESKSVADTAPAEWTVVTRDLFTDFGDMTLTGMAFTPMDGTGGLFDHVLLGRTVEDLDAKSNELLGRTKPTGKLDGKARDDAWAALGGRDTDKAGPALRAFLQAAPEQVGFVRDRLAAVDADQQKELRKKVAQLVSQLGDDDFDTRVTAERELEALGDTARDEIVEAMKSPNAEVAFRAKALAARQKFDGTGVPLAAVRAARVVRVLEQANTKDAKELLAKMSDGDFGPSYPAVAKAAMARMPK